MLNEQSWHPTSTVPTTAPAAVAVEAAITAECKKLNIDPFGESCFSGRKMEREKNKTFQ